MIGPLKIFSPATISVSISSNSIGAGGRRKGADSYFPPEDRVRLVRLVSHGELPGERSGEVTTEISQNNL